MRFIFQPAEEVSVGAYQVIENRGLKDVSAIIGYHNYPSFETWTKSGCAQKLS